MQTMQWFAFPLVFFRPGHALSLRPVLLQRHLPQGHRPACVFKFSSQVDDVVGVSVGRFFVSVYFGGSLLYINFRERTFEFGYLWLVGIVRCFFASTSALLERLLPEKCAKKFCLCQVRVFCVVLSFLSFVVAGFLRMSCWFLSLSLSLLFFLLRDKDQANRSHSPPARFVGLVLFFLLFFSRAAVFFLLLVRPFRPCVLLFLRSC